MPVESCPACGSARVRFLPTTRGAGRTIFECRTCKTAGWRDRDSLDLPEIVGLDVISLEQHRTWHEGLREIPEESWDAALDQLTAAVGGAQGKRLYDIGSGDGAFSAKARERGFHAGGNDLLQAAVDLADEVHGITLDLGDISTLDLDPQDVITLWCVIAHVEDPAGLLASCHAKLADQGVVYLQTPNRTFIDGLALAVVRLTGGRFSRLVDRRIAGHHWLLSTPKGITALLRRLGYTDVAARPMARYSLQTWQYVQWLGIKGRLNALVTKVAEAMINRGLAPRIVLEVEARK